MGHHVMTERQLQFQVGLFVLVAFVVAGVLVVQFGDLKKYWRETYPIAVHFDEASGVHPGTPVRQHGLSIGAVKEVILDEVEGGVMVVLNINSDRKIRKDARVAMTLSLFGDAVVEFSGGKSTEYLAKNKKIRGQAAVNPMEIVQRMEINVNQTMQAFTETSREWESVGKNLNRLMETKQGSLDEVIERAALALSEFTKTMRSADVALTQAKNLIGDPRLQEDIKRTIASLPNMVDETHQTISETRKTVKKISENLENLNAATAPLAKYSTSLVTRLDSGMRQFEILLTELNAFARTMNDNEGTLQKFVADPALYENLNRSATALAIVMENLAPTIKDLRIFADKVARHPELIGLSGAIKGSTGIKDSSQGVQPAGHSQPQK